ncbi:competence protein TfoX [Paenibacillus zeisoli]|uniref:Competence protein TfoX n=1 Tax=Paenibacillus zeisoli TaxID=2496267 RepID=A0A433XD54_9BACL|nr:TfoX/Sxy family protein [Paenibacillus zeisoli]RUT31996.1 competence protein TfoX [Paenibacillus zeisoli]
MSKLSDLPNIGQVLEAKLIASGIKTPLQLIELGSREAYARIHEQDSSACLHMLYALEGAVQGVRSHQLPKSTQRELIQEFKILNQITACAIT